MAEELTPGGEGGESDATAGGKVWRVAFGSVRHVLRRTITFSGEPNFREPSDRDRDELSGSGRVRSAGREGEVFGKRGCECGFGLGFGFGTEGMPRARGAWFRP